MTFDREEEDQSAGRLVMRKFPEGARREEQGPSNSKEESEEDYGQGGSRRSEEPMQQEPDQAESEDDKASTGGVSFALSSHTPEPKRFNKISKIFSAVSRWYCFMAITQFRAVPSRLLVSALHSCLSVKSSSSKCSFITSIQVSIQPSDSCF